MALVSNYDGFIFDYGGVLVHHQTEADQARMAGIIGIDAEKFTELYWSDRLDYDKGLMSGSDYWYRLAASAGKSVDEHQIEDLIEIDSVSWMQFDTVMWDWIDQLRAAGKRTAMLSNMPRDLGETLKARTDRLRCFDQVTLSYEVRAAKPDAVIYEHCIEGLATPRERTLFLDDRIANVHGAEVMGIHAMQFISRDDVLLQLRA
jgi:putative hydrolase of the HAD superfamily